MSKILKNANEMKSSLKLLWVHKSQSYSFILLFVNNNQMKGRPWVEKGVGGGTGNDASKQLD